jgi:hypothetical protein
MALLAAVVTMLAAAALAPQWALARASYLHGGITDCETCHVNAHTWWTPTNEHCLGCHPGFQVRDQRLFCWTCHAPGQDMSAARGDAACTAPCHLPGGSTITHAAHPDRSSACTSCHPVSASPADPAGSAHHTVPAPVLTGVTPGSGIPGTEVVLSGSHFTDATVVRFNGAWTAFVVESDATITALVPAGATTGPVSVITRGGTATTTQAFVVSVVPSISLRLSPAVVGQGRRVKFGGALAPRDLAGATVTIVVQLRRDGHWRTVRTAPRATSSEGLYSWSYAPSRKGVYRAAAAVAASLVNLDGRSAWAGFRVR